MVKKRNIIGVDRRGGRGYVQMDCSRGIAENCRGAAFVPRDVDEVCCAYCTVQLAGMKPTDESKKIRKTPQVRGKGKRRGK